MEKSDVIIIGGGVMGLSSAYYLQQAGCKVTLVEKGDMEDGCSYGNAGLVTPSHFVPLAAPGMIKKGILWMFNPESPFYIKPKLDLNLISWAWKFYKAASPKKVLEAAPVLRDLSFLSKQLFQAFAKQEDFAFAFKEQGIYMMYKTAKAEAEELHNLQMAKDLGVAAKVLSGEEVQKMEPDVELDIKGAVYYPDDAHLSPRLFLQSLKTYLQNNGVQILVSTKVEEIELENGKIQRIITDKGSFSAAQYVLATGSWSPLLTKKLALNLPIQAGKGYSFTLDKPKQQLSTPAILMEAKIAVTPMQEQLRFAGTMEIAGLDLRINPRRVKGITKSIPAYLPAFEFQDQSNLKVWSGLRPCSPDGLPFIGRSKTCQNLLIAAGHAMLGLSLGPVTGKLISEIALAQKTSCNIDLLRPDRYN